MQTQWSLTNQMLADVCIAMAAHAHRFSVAIHRVISDDFGEPCGTGTYLNIRNNTYLLTNEHVAAFVQLGGLSHQPREGDFAHRIVHPFLAMGPPVDAAVSRIDDESWALATKDAVKASRIARTHSTAVHELLFVHGYPGERSRWSAFAGGPISRAVPYLTQEAPLPSELDPRVFFALHYSPEHASAVDGKGSHLPLPPGFSGSLVWNTRFVELNGQGWSPEEAVPTGLVCMWGQGDMTNLILAVRIEIVRAMLLRALRQEHAYFHWLDRGCPAGDPMTDWAAAERDVVDVI
jgi:hypothetical protein